MNTQKKPYLIVPKLIEQPTWGGDYILKMKGWEKRIIFKNKKIGQSYELCGQSQLSLSNSSSLMKDEEEGIDISTFKEKRPFPLIKFTQAQGNSFQLHVKQSEQGKEWRAKAESWFYLENGKVTLGIKKNADIHKYKRTCLDIEKTMKELSALVKRGELKRKEAERVAKLFIEEKNPWQFVNVLDVKKGDVIDLSVGGLHHSWEEDKEYPLGNIVYEVQQDVDDQSSTIRSFDQGKFKENGDVREIAVDDYFSFLDNGEENNHFDLKKKDSVHLFETPYYCLDRLLINKETAGTTSSSFHHLFVVGGEIRVFDGKNAIVVQRGHSCFIPQGIAYTIKSQGKTELLKTFLP